MDLGKAWCYWVLTWQAMTELINGRFLFTLCDPPVTINRRRRSFDALPRQTAA